MRDTGVGDDFHGPRRPLWAPWRIEYIRAASDGECFLCRKGAAGQGAEGEGVSPDRLNHVIGRGRTCFVLLNDYPYNSGHLLVAPYRHAADLVDLTAEELNEVMSMCVRARRVLEATLAPEGFNLGFNLGACAGAGVRDHVHGHIVPRWTGDTNFMPVLGNPRVVPEALDATASLLRRAWEELADRPH